jgi:hypothetical protein
VNAKNLSKFILTLLFLRTTLPKLLLFLISLDIVGSLIQVYILKAVYYFNIFRWILHLINPLKIISMHDWGEIFATHDFAVIGYLPAVNFYTK